MRAGREPPNSSCCKAILRLVGPVLASRRWPPGSRRNSPRTACRVGPVAAIEPPADEQTAELLAELRGVVESVHAAQSDAVSLDVRRAELERQIRERAWTQAGGGAVHRPADVADVVAAVVAREVA